MGIWHWLSGLTCETMGEKWPLDGEKERAHPCNNAFANATQPPCQSFLLREPASFAKKGLWGKLDCGIIKGQAIGNNICLAWNYHAKSVQHDHFTFPF
jgi:hypothetical protein